jgi:23S rRNA (cytosine1962-C5)-methyltransferase
VLERGRENIARIGLLGAGDHVFVAEDVFAWLARAAKKAERFDVVILDPPSYSNTKKRRFSSESDYDELAAAALRVVAPGGRLLACSNHRGIRQTKLRKFLRDAARVAEREIAQLKDMPCPLDFPPALGRESHLKSALVTLVG